MDEIVLQSILDADKNGTLKLFREKESRKIQIFYGVLLLEIVPNDSDHISYRAAAGRLYNAGLKRKTLSVVFGVDRRTLQSWGRALLLDDKKEAVILFLEIVNIEQSKYLDFNSLNLLLGETIRRPQVQRKMLNDLAHEDIFNRLFKLNGELCDIDNRSDFYYDPHTKQYTGIQKILKGWCGALGRPDKALHSDFIHSSTGQPLFMVHADNYFDLREKYNSVILKFRKCFDIDNSKCITMIIDRGIYKIDVLNDIEKNPQLNIITWEKNFKKDELLWEKNEISHFSMIRHRNSSKDIRYYKYQYIGRVTFR